jgi:hypothetical protein
VFLLVVRQPQLQHGAQAFAAGLLSRFPDGPKHFNHLRAILGWTTFAHCRIAAPAGAGVQQLDGVLAAVAKLLAHLINEARTAFPPTGSRIAAADVAAFLL